MKIIIVYKSISGFTEKYAKWIAKELGGDIKKQSEVNQKFLEKYDLIIYGGSLHASGIIGLKRINFLFTKLKNKKLIVFAVGASSPKKGVVDEIKNNNFDGDQTMLFYLRGGFNFNKLNLINKIIMFIFIHLIKHKSKKSDDDIGMISAYEKPVDFTKKENINDLVNYVKNELK